MVLAKNLAASPVILDGSASGNGDARCRAKGRGSVGPLHAFLASFTRITEAAGLPSE